MENQILNKPAFTLTAGELVTLIVERINIPKPEIISKERKTVRGIHGLAKELNLSPVTVQAWKNSGKIPYSQYGRVVLFDVEAVLNAISNNKKK